MENIQVVRVEMVKDKTIEYGKKQIKGLKDIAGIGLKLLKKSDREVFIVVCLSTKNEINNVQVVAIGTLGLGVLHPREIFKAAILSNSSAIALVHNHPSGNLDPSKEDIRTTERLIEVGKVIDIPVLDHVIVGYGDYFSFTENNICTFV